MRSRAQTQAMSHFVWSARAGDDLDAGMAVLRALDAVVDEVGEDDRRPPDEPDTSCADGARPTTSTRFLAVSVCPSRVSPPRAGRARALPW
jgi:hypothetical protein